MRTDPLSKTFTPAWWLPEGHSQTLWRKFTATQTAQHSRQRIELSDGDYIDLDWALQPDAAISRSNKITVVLHGLCGCSESPYVVSLQNLLSEGGHSSVAMNFRGCSGTVNRLARAYHSGVSSDLDQVFAQLSSRYPNYEFNFVGYSLGANVLLKWLGETGGYEQVANAVAVSTPFQLAQCSQAMLEGSSRIYGRYFFKVLTSEFSKKLDHFKSIGAESEVKTLSALKQMHELETLWDFDDHITAPLHGFSNAQDYYSQCSSAGFIEHINTPTLLIHSSNDPLIPQTAIPQPKDLPATVEMELYAKGGHVGFISGIKNNWLEQRIVERVIR